MYVPENQKIKSLQYGAHWSRPGRSGWYVRMDGGPWVMACSTPASDELPDDYDEAYLEAVAEDRQTLVNEVDQADLCSPESVCDVVIAAFMADSIDEGRAELAKAIAADQSERSRLGVE